MLIKSFISRPRFYTLENPVEQFTYWFQRMPHTELSSNSSFPSGHSSQSALSLCAVTLLLTTEHKKSSLPFLSVLSYVLFLVLFLFLGGYTFLNTFRGEMLLMQIAVTCCLIVSIVVTYYL